jgi:hypothetical protein
MGNGSPMEPTVIALHIATKLHREWVRRMKAIEWATENGPTYRFVSFHFSYGDGYTGSGGITLSIPVGDDYETVTLDLTSDKAGNLQGTLRR